MSEVPLLIILVVVLFGLLALGLWIAVAIGIAGLAVIFLSQGAFAFQTLADIAFNTANSFVLSAVPLYILMGELILNSGLSERFYRGISVWLNRVPGNLLHTNIVACGIFAAVSGSSVATAAAIGTVAVPEMKQQGYDNKLVFGSLAAGGTLGILIPPSIALIIYAALVRESVSDLFIAGIVPGLLMMGLFMSYILVRASVQSTLTPEGFSRFTWRERFVGLLAILPVVLLVIVILIGIYLGIMTPTEAAAVGAMLAVILAVAVGNLRWGGLTSALKRTVQTTCMVLFIIVGAQIVSFALAVSGISRAISEGVVGLGVTPGLLFLLIIVLYLILGAFIDGISMILITLPILFPVIQQVGFDPVWFGIVAVIMIEVGQITPPVGLNLFVLHSISGGRPFKEVVLGTLPYVGIMLVVVAMLWIWPSIALWLPQQGAQQ